MLRSMTEATNTQRRGQKLRGGETAWSRLRLSRNLSISELAEQAGLARSIVGLIDQGRMIPGPKESAALLRVLEPGAAA